MYIFKNDNWKLEEIKQLKFSLEKEMQILTEKNLENIFWLEFIATEFQLNNLRIDTLAFDNETNSFVIIEYKRWTSYSVVDQWMTYLALLLNNKADFIQELARKRNKFIDKKDIDWSQSKVIIVADSFNRYQKESINFKDLPIELYELKQFENWIIVYNPIIADNTTQSIKTITKFQTKEFKEVNKEIKTYDEYYHLNWVNKEIKEIYEDLKSFILSLNPNIRIEYRKVYIAFKLGKNNIVDITIKKSLIKLRLNLKWWEIIDNYWLCKNVSQQGHWWNWDYEIKIYDKTNLWKVKDLIKQAYLKYNL